MAVVFRQIQIDQRQVERRELRVPVGFIEDGDRLLAIAGGCQFIVEALLLENIANDENVGRVVFDQENAERFRMFLTRLLRLGCR